MKQAKMEEGNGVDHFARIPEELLSLILSRFEDLKHLCGYSLVSKRFALAIYELRSVHLTLPSTTHTDKICELLPKLAGFTSEEMSELIKSSPIKELGVFSFLRNFKELRSISLDLTCPLSICSSSRWKVRMTFSNGGALVELFLELPAYVPGQASSSDEASLSDEASSSEEASLSDEFSSDDEYAPADKGMRNDTLFLFGCCSVWLLVLCLLRKCHPSLASVTITNRKKWGRLFVSNINHLVWRNKLKEAQLGSLNQTIAWMCDSKTPESGYVVKVVNYGTLDPVDELDHDSGMLDGGDVVTYEYTGDEKDLRDLLLEFVSKYKESFPYY